MPSLLEALKKAELVDKARAESIEKERSQKLREEEQRTSTRSSPKPPDEGNK